MNESAATLARRYALRAAAIAGTSAAASALGSVAAASVFARLVLTPDRRRPDDTRIVAADDETVLLRRAPQVLVPGRYGLWLQGGAGHARLGEIVEEDGAAGTVRRRLLGVDRGLLEPGPGRWSQYYFGGPPDESAGLPLRHAWVRTELGPMPAWRVDPDGGSGRRWAVLVHGRGARREETIRAMAPLRRAGYTSLAISYRNDEGVPRGPDGRYNLGLSEWRDVEAGVRHAVRSGASEVVLVGWSMGGAITLQFLDRSELAGAVSRVVLDAPVIDWGAVLAHHAHANHLPGLVESLSRLMMGRTWGKRLVGVHDILDVAQTDWVTRSDELRHPMLIIHSTADDFVPAAPSIALAARRPDLVTLPDWSVARHCGEWNVDSARWEDEVERYVSD